MPSEYWLTFSLLQRCNGICKFSARYLCIEDLHRRWNRASIAFGPTPLSRASCCAGLVPTSSRRAPHVTGLGTWSYEENLRTTSCEKYNSGQSHYIIFTIGVKDAVEMSDTGQRVNRSQIAWWIESQKPKKFGKVLFLWIFF